MSAPRRRLVALFGGTLSCLLLSSQPARAQVAPTKPEVQAPVTLASVLERIGAELPIEIRIDPALAGRHVDVDLTGLPPFDSLRQALVSAGVDFVIVERGTRLLAVIGDLADAKPLQRHAVPAVSTIEMPAAPGAPGERPEDKNEPTEVDDATPVPAEGEVSGAALTALLSPVSAGAARARAAGWIDLPFPDDSGMPVRVWRSGVQEPVIQLPFTDAAGQAVIQVAPVQPSEFIELPFPDASGQPIRVPRPVTGPVSSPRPGVPPGL